MQAQIDTDLAVGIDISKKSFDAYIAPIGASLGSFANDKKGFIKLEKLLKKHGEMKLLCYEATGIYHRQLELYFHNKGYNLLRTDPRKSSNFAKFSHGALKTDKVDAKHLAEIGLIHKGAYSTPPSELLVEMRAVYSLRKNAMKYKIALNIDFDPVVKRATKEAEQAMKEISDKIAEYDRILRQLIDLSEETRRIYSILTSIPAIGPIVAISLICELPEIGSISNAKLASLAGVAPINQQSGRHNPNPHIKGGRKSLQPPLFMAALSAMQNNPIMRKFYERQKKLGKPQKVIIVAIMRKLLITANALVRDGKPWQADHVSVPPY